MKSKCIAIKEDFYIEENLFYRISITKIRTMYSVDVFNYREGRRTLFPNLISALEMYNDILLTHDLELKGFYDILE
jgi:hypothetical protein